MRAWAQSAGVKGAATATFVFELAVEIRWELVRDRGNGTSTVLD